MGKGKKKNKKHSHKAKENQSMKDKKEVFLVDTDSSSSKNDDTVNLSSISIADVCREKEFHITSNVEGAKSREMKIQDSEKWSHLSKNKEGSDEEFKHKATRKLLNAEDSKSQASCVDTSDNSSLRKKAAHREEARYDAYKSPGCDRQHENKSNYSRSENHSQYEDKLDKLQNRPPDNVGFGKPRRNTGENSNNWTNKDAVKTESNGNNSGNRNPSPHKIRNPSSHKSRNPSPHKSSNSFKNKSRSREKDKEYDIWDTLYKKNDKDIDFKVVCEVDGDLFAAGLEYSLGHCVAEDMNMGSGIAVTFRQEFKQVAELLNQRKSQGQVAVLKDRQRYIYYLVTKRYSNRKPTYYSLWSSLQRMKEHIKEHHVEKLALPRIGCGLDNLEWKLVKKMLEYIFGEVDIEIIIYNFQQNPDAVTPTKPRKCPLKNVPYTISEISYGTIIVYFGSEDGFESEDLTTLSEKYPFVRNSYKSGKRKVGTFIRTERYQQGYNFYGCIVRKHHRDNFDFIHFQNCLKNIQTQNRRDRYDYVAFQAFMEEGESMTVSKIVNLMRYALTHVEVYVCWPKSLLQYMPREYY